MIRMLLVGFRSALGPLLALSLLACAEPQPPYQPRTDGYGYADARIDDHTYRVEYAGDRFTSQETVEDYLLYRAAELTLENGYESFQMIDKIVDHAAYYGPSYPHGFGHPYSAYGQRLRSAPFQQVNPFIYPSYAGSREETQYRATATVRFIPASSQPPGDVHNAREVVKALDTKVERPEEGAY